MSFYGGTEHAAGHHGDAFGVQELLGERRGVHAGRADRRERVERASRLGAVEPDLAQALDEHAPPPGPDIASTAAICEMCGAHSIVYWCTRTHSSATARGAQM